MNISAIIWVLLISSHGKAMIVYTGYETELKCATDAKRMVKIMDKKTKWDCYPVIMPTERRI
jgi:hypothetical protein